MCHFIWKQQEERGLLSFRSFNIEWNWHACREDNERLYYCSYFKCKNRKYIEMHKCWPPTSTNSKSRHLPPYGNCFCVVWSNVFPPRHTHAHTQTHTQITIMNAPYWEGLGRGQVGKGWVEYRGCELKQEALSIFTRYKALPLRQKKRSHTLPHQ